MSAEGYTYITDEESRKNDTEEKPHEKVYRNSAGSHICHRSYRMRRQGQHHH